MPPDGMLRCPGAEKGTLGAVPLAFVFFFKKGLYFLERVDLGSSEHYTNQGMGGK